MTNESHDTPALGRMDVTSLKHLLDTGADLHLLDVRTPHEWEIARIEGATLLDESAQKIIRDIPSDAMIVVYCHHGIRSLHAADHLLSMGFQKVYNLEGGINAWSIEVDPGVRRY